MKYCKDCKSQSWCYFNEGGNACNWFIPKEVEIKNA